MAEAYSAKFESSIARSLSLKDLLHLTLPLFRYLPRCIPEERRDNWPEYLRVLSSPSHRLSADT